MPNHEYLQDGEHIPHYQTNKDDRWLHKNRKACKETNKILYMFHYVNFVSSKVHIKWNKSIQPTTKSR